MTRRPRSLSAIHSLTPLRPLFLVLTLALAPAAVTATDAATAAAVTAEGAVTAGAGSPDEGKPAPPSLTVSRWLVLGPAGDPLPVFGGEKPGAFGLEDLLKSDRFPRDLPWPAAGESAGWFAGGRLTWTELEAGGDGTVALERPADSAAKRPAVAWLAAYLGADRFHALDLEIPGSHPRRVWLDGEAVCLGGIAKEGSGAEVKGKIKLTTGKHLLLVETILDPEREAPWTAGALLKGAKDAPAITGLVANTDPARDLDLLDVIDPPRVTSLALSPDGAIVAAVLTRIVPGTDDSESWLELRSTPDGALRRTWRGGPVPGQVTWAPSGNRLTYVTEEKDSEGEEAGSTLWIADLDAGTVEPVVERVREFSSYLWSPAGDAIVYAVSVKPEPDKRGLKRHENLLDRQADYRTKRRLHLVAYPGRARRTLTAGSLTASAAAFSPDGRRLVFSRSVEDLADRPYTREEIWEIDLAKFEARKLRDARWVNDVQYAPDGKRLIVHGSPSTFGKAGWNVPEGVIPNENEGEAYVWDPAADEVEPITRHFDPSVEKAVWSRSDGRIYVLATDRDRESLFRYDAASKRFEKIEAGAEVVDECAFAERAPVAACTGTSPWTPQSMSAVDLRTGSSRTLLRPAERWFANVRRGAVEDFDFKASNGRTIEGRVYLPPGFDAARPGRYPVIVDYYGGTSPVERDFGGRYPKEWWASQGYVVYVPQPSGAYGYGQAFAATHVNDWGKTTSQEILDGTRAFLAAHPYADPKRVGIIGASYGGFMTMVLVTKTDQYAAAVAHAGISSLSSYWGEGYWGYSYSASATAGSFPWNRKDIYVENSPLFSADKVKTPVLLTHGSADTNVPRGESWSFYTALKLVGAPVELVEVEGLDHLIMAHAKRIAWSRTIVAWFDKWLKGQPEWWDDLYTRP